MPQKLLFQEVDEKEPILSDYFRPTKKKLLAIDDNTIFFSKNEISLNTKSKNSLIIQFPSFYLIFIKQIIIPMILGRFSPQIFFKVFSLTLFLTLPLIYYQSQKYGHEQKIAWISGCAQHYPEFLFFRIATISCSALVTLGWLTNNFFLKTISRENSFHLQKYQPQIPMVLGMMGSILLMISTACLDTGYRHGPLHVHCASSFFVLSFFAILYNTALYWLVQYHTQALNKTLLTLKTVIAVFLIIQVIINTRYGYESQVNGEQVKSTISIILQWLGSFSLGLYYLVLSQDYKHFNFQFELIEQS